MKGIQIHLRNDHVTNENKDNIKLYDNQTFSLTRHVLPKDALYYISPQKSAEAVKTYYIESGTMRLLEEDVLLGPGDMIFCNDLEDMTILHFLTEGSILAHNFMESPEFTFDSRMNALESLMKKIQEKDTYTREHCQRVLQLVKQMGLALGYKSIGMNNLTKAARFHDIGKIYIQDDILNKPSALSPLEYKSIMEHVALGRSLLVESFESDVFAIVEQHHERLDGSGYPNGLKGSEIREEARVIAICDSFDAMTTDRVYKKGISHVEAFHELRQLSGTLYDGELVELFIQLMESSHE